MKPKKKLTLKSKSRALVACLLAAVLLVWLFYFLFSLHTLVTVERRAYEGAALRAVNALEEDFLEIEQLLFTLGQSPVVHSFSAEQNALAYHQKAAGVAADVAALSSRTKNIDSLLIYSNEEMCYRFMGNLGNSALRSLYYKISGTPPGVPVPVLLEGIRYLCYTWPVRQQGTQTGVLAALVDEGRLRARLGDYGDYDGANVALVSGGQVIFSSDGQHEGAPVEQLRQGKDLWLARQAGFMPVELVISGQNVYLRRSAAAFLLAALATAAVFVGLLAGFSRMLNRHLLRPSLSIIQDVETLEESGTLALNPTGEEQFDRLVDKINEMVWRLDERSKALFETRFRLQNAEIARQKADIAALKKQISAHFAVNTLENIRLLAQHGDTEKAAQVSEGLSHLLSYANAGDEHISCLDEFLVLEQYTEIMKLRYPGRFAVNFEVDDRLVDTAMPRMLVQPLLENAILYGVLGGGDHVLVSAALQGSEIEIAVHDNGPGMPPEKQNALLQELAQACQLDEDVGGLEHVALKNIARRLHTWYGTAAVMQLESAQGAGTCVTLRFPAQGA